MPVGKRVLMLLENNPYPQDERVRNEATTLVQAGYQVFVVCPAKKSQKRSEVINNVMVSRYRPLELGDGPCGYILEYTVAMVSMFFKSMYLFMRYGFDFVHLHNPPDTLSLIFIPYVLVGKLCIYDHHDLAGELYYFGRAKKAKSRSIYRVLLFLEKLSYRIAHHVIVTNESYKAVAIERGGLDESELTVVRNGPPSLQFLLSDSPTGKRDNSLTIGYAGIIAPQDGVDHLIRALHHLVTVRRRTDFTCIVAGDGSALSEIRDLTQALHLGDFVRFLGFLCVERLFEALERTSICVAPEPSNIYNDRSTMVKIMDYMAVGKPIVAFDLPEHRASAGGAALYAVPNDDVDLADKIEQLMDDPDLRESLGLIGKRRIAETLSWDCQAKELLRAYEKTSRLGRSCFRIAQDNPKRFRETQLAEAPKR